VLRAFKIPDIDLLEAIYSVATVSFVQSQESGGGITFDTGVQQGGRVLWDQGVRDLRRLAREAIPLASRPTLSRHLLFREGNMVDPQETAFVRTEEQRSGTQEVRILAPRMSLLLQSAKKLEKKLRLNLKSLLLNDRSPLYSVRLAPSFRRTALHRVLLCPDISTSALVGLFTSIIYVPRLW